MAAVSMAALNCSASLLGLSKTEVDVFVVTYCPFGWGRQVQARRDRCWKTTFPA